LDSTAAFAPLAVGVPYPDETQICMKDVLFGAIGHPKYDNDPTAKVRPEQGLLLMRKNRLICWSYFYVPSLIDNSPLKESVSKEPI
jgi:3-isopropylmalate dehydrogenase